MVERNSNVLKDEHDLDGVNMGYVCWACIMDTKGGMHC